MRKTPERANLESLEGAERATHRELWDRLPTETESAFSAFKRFRDADEPRSLTAVAKELSCTKQNLHRWSWRYRWHDRVTAFEVYRDEVHLTEMAKGRAEMRQRQAKCGVLIASPRT